MNAAKPRRPDPRPGSALKQKAIDAEMESTGRTLLEHRDGNPQRIATSTALDFGPRSRVWSIRDRVRHAPTRHGTTRA